MVLTDEEVSGSSEAKESVFLDASLKDVILDSQEKLKKRSVNDFLAKRRDIAVKGIDEEYIKEVTSQKKNSTTLEDWKILDLELRGSSRDKKLTYETLIDWGDFNLADIIEKMVKFGQVMSGVELKPYQIGFQKRILESVMLNDGEVLTALFSRQSGKTEVVAVTVDILLILLPVLAKVFPDQLGQFKDGIRVGLFAPTGEMGMTAHKRMDMRLSSKAAAAVLADSDIQGTKVYNGGELKVLGPRVKIGGQDVPEFVSFVKFQSAAKQTKIESKTYDLIIIEEAQDVDSFKITKSIMPMLAATNGTTVMVGTPAPYKNHFYDAILNNRVRQTQLKIQNHFEYDYKTVQKYNPRYKAFIQKEKERIGEDSESFRLAYALEWLFEQGMAISSYELNEFMLDYGAGFFYAKPMDPAEMPEGSFFAAGLDLAKSQDSTVLTIAIVIPVPNTEKFIKKVVNWVEFSGDNWEIQIAKILEIVMSYDIRLLGVDATGKGDPIVDRLKRELENSKCEVKGVIFSSKSKHDMSNLFYEEMRNKRIRIPYTPAVRNTKRFQNFHQQMLTCEKKYNGSNHLAIAHPNIPGAKDDFVDSLLILNYIVGKFAHFSGEILDNPFFKPSRGEEIVSRRMLQILGRKGYKAKFG